MTGLRVSSTEFLFNYTQIFLFLKVTTFGKCSHIILLYIGGYDNISWRPHNTPFIPKSWGRDTPSRIVAYDSWCLSWH